MSKKPKSKLPKDIEKKIEVEELAMKIKLLFGFCATLIPHKEMLKDLVDDSEKRSSFSLSAAPVLTAFGEDYEAMHFEAELHRKRAKALYELIEILDATEKERAEFQTKQGEKAKGAAQIRKMFGL